MTTPNRPPIPSGDIGAGFPQVIHHDTGKPVLVADMRAEFERLSRQAPRDPEAERAFIESKIEIIRQDSKLPEAEKDRAIEELRRSL
jgi:hypothetical protein